MHRPHANTVISSTGLQHFPFQMDPISIPVLHCRRSEIWKILERMKTDWCLKSFTCLFDLWNIGIRTHLVGCRVSCIEWVDKSGSMFNLFDLFALMTFSSHNSINIGLASPETKSKKLTRHFFFVFLEIKKGKPANRQPTEWYFNAYVSLFVRVACHVNRLNRNHCKCLIWKFIKCARTKCLRRCLIFDLHAISTLNGSIPCTPSTEHRLLGLSI